ncbi:acyl-CoA dehydrogenase family protein [Subtercola frigoramans]|uniref:Alkylation response protein AidB-like acyl-CoA dehydrogenase n=1 Tax=Subtercola frigoramans TaxID=120298 RepID=A0ABS2L7D9_9MICO|nr:acyl-CoA dehydrogenase family protein [Subtercola frigoramans]MBM7473022.1 alkylation response protein AidB-like acyl-CoA dehydrogenase [Subtercola frigoramans]
MTVTTEQPVESTPDLAPTPPTSDHELGLLAPTSASAVLQNSHTVVPFVHESADAIEEARRLTPEVARVFRDAGFFQMGFPAARGGLELTLAQQVEVVTRIARADASAGWNVGVLNATGFYAGRLGDDAFAELYPTFDLPTSGSFHPRGRADKVDGGYQVSGEWDWGSGSYTAEYVLGGCFAFEDGEPLIGASGAQLVLGVWLPRDAIVVAHNWQTLGVRGSGSTSYSVPVPVFVPERHTFDREAPSNGDRDPLNKSVHIAFFGLTGVPLGIAQHAADLAVESVRARVGTRGSAALDTATKHKLGEILAEVDYGYAGVIDVARRTDELLFEPGRALTEAQIARMVAGQAAATAMMRRVVALSVELVSAKYLFDDHPMQRVIRDSYGATAHVGGRAMMLGLLAASILDDREAGVLLIDDVANEPSTATGAP